MQNIYKLMMAGVLIAGGVVAQEKSESVESILKELGSYQKESVATVAGASEKAVPLAPKKAEAEKASAVVQEAIADMRVVETVPAVEVPPVTAKEEVPEAVVNALDLPATLDASRELYVGGEFEQAQRGFEAVIRKDPENVLARLYLRKLLERDHRTVEVGGMKEVSAAWNIGRVLRSYSISEEAAKKMGLEQVADATDVTVKFPEVDFPKGASAVYQPKMGKLFVRNTRENLQILEEILDAMDVTKHSADVDQVEIEAKFVEVSEGTLEELGFQWDFKSSVQTGIGGEDVIANDGMGLFSGALRGTARNPEIPFDRTADVAGDTLASSGDWKAFRFDDTFSSEAAMMTLHHDGSNPLDVFISALDQSSGTDVLSAPRITAKSGEKAVIRVGQLHYFPETYEVGGNEGTIVHVSYLDFAEKLLGVELEVKPKVDGNQITLGLNPKVSELIGWQNYLVAPANSAYSYYQIGINQQFNHDPINARLPVFKRREIKTQLTVASGSTIGMGGLISDKIERFEDKVPFLGNVPLVGRLFRSEGQRNIKRNLMIFVTATKVEPNGRMVSTRSFE